MPKVQFDRFYRYKELTNILHDFVKTLPTWSGLKVSERATKTEISGC